VKDAQDSKRTWRSDRRHSVIIRNAQHCIPRIASNVRNMPAQKSAQLGAQSQAAGPRALRAAGDGRRPAALRATSVNPINSLMSKDAPDKSGTGLFAPGDRRIP